MTETDTVTEPTGLVVNPDLTGDDDEQLPDGVVKIGDPLPPGRTELFRVNGNVYTIPRVVDPRIAFRYLRDIRRNQDQAVAMSNMMFAILGDAVMDALAEEELSPAEFDQVMKAVQKHSMSAMKNTLGN